MNMVSDPYETQQTMQPNVQLSSQPGQPLVSGLTQQLVQPTVQTFTPGLVQQPRPSSPRTLPQIATTTIATSIQPTTPISRVLVALGSNVLVLVQTPQASLPQLGPTVQTSVQMIAGQAGPGTAVTSQPQFIYQTYQGKYQFIPTVQKPVYQYQPYLGYTYQQPQQPQFGSVNLGFSGGYNIPNANPIPGYPGYPPYGFGLVTHGFRDNNFQLPFIATLDLLVFLHLMNDSIYYLSYWPQMPNNLPSDILKFEGKSGEDPSNHVMTYHFWCASNSIIDDSIQLHFFQ